MVIKSVAIAAGLFALLYLVVIVLLYVFQEKLVFPGSSLPPDYEFHFNQPFRELTIAVDGARLNALHFQQENPRGVIFFLHGNGGNLVDWTVNSEWYQRHNYDLFIFDYRGYGKSTGRITGQQQLMDDVRLAWREMQKHYEAVPIVIYGRSLGTALAAQLATEVEAELVVLVSPFTSMLAMARRNYPFVPTFLVRYPLRTDEVLGLVHQRMILIHGDRDEVIPIQHSQKLLTKAGPSTDLFTIEGAAHNDIHEFPDYLSRLAEALP